MAEQGKILVIGATGNVGRQVVSQLLDTGATVRALARDPDTAGLPDGVEVLRGDLTAPDTVETALDRITSVFLVWPFLTADAAPVIVDTLARHARHIVYLSSASGRSEDDEPGGAVAFHAEVERLIERSGAQWTFLRAGGFAANTLGWAAQIRTDGVVRQPYGQAARSLIHEADIAAVAVRALTGDKHAGATYVLTGPQVLTQAEQVRTIGEAVGRPLRWEELDAVTARQQMIAAGWTPSFADGALTAWAGMITHPEPVTHTVEQVTGTPARTFGTWAADHAADFR